MAKKPIRPVGRNQPRAYRAPAASSAAPADAAQVTEQEQDDWNNAMSAAAQADKALAQAEGMFQEVVTAAQAAEDAAAWAVRTAEQAEEDAAWVLADAERMVAAARARVEAARGLARTGRTVAAEAQEGEWDAEKADPDVAPTRPILSPPFQAAHRAMDAVSRQPHRGRYN